MGKVYKVISDIHGTYQPLKKVVKEINFKKEKLVVIGDMIDRGTESFHVVNTIYQLQNKYSSSTVIVTLGNHEYFLLMWLGQSKKFTQNNNRNKLVKSLLPYSSHIMKYIKPTLTNFYSENNIELNGICLESSYEIFYEHFTDICDWLCNLPIIVEKKNVIFVHGGIDITKYQYDKSSLNLEYLDYRYWWYDERKTKSNKLIVFGHTPVRNIHGTDDIYYDKKRNIVGIDGGVSMGGQLNVVCIKKGNIVY